MWRADCRCSDQDFGLVVRSDTTPSRSTSFVTTLGKLFTHVSPSSITRHGPHDWCCSVTGKTVKVNDNPGVLLVICHRFWYAHVQAQQSCSHRYGRFDLVPITCDPDLIRLSPTPTPSPAENSFPVNNNSCVILSRVFLPLISVILFWQKFVSQCSNASKKLIMQTCSRNSKSTQDSFAAGASLETLLKKFTALPHTP